MNTSGFSLLEFLVYLAVSAFLLAGVFKFFNGVQSSFVQLRESSFIMNSLQNTSDMIRHDIMGADCQADAWHKDAHEFVCKSGGQSVGWQLKKNRLYRITGTYDFESKQWKQQRKAIVAQQVKDFSIQIPNGSLVTTVHIAVTFISGHNQRSKEYDVMVYNRVLA